MKKCLGSMIYSNNSNQILHVPFHYNIMPFVLILIIILINVFLFSIYHLQKCESETEDDEPSSITVKLEIKKEELQDANSSLNITTAHGDESPRSKETIKSLSNV